MVETSLQVTMKLYYSLSRHGCNDLRVKVIGKSDIHGATESRNLDELSIQVIAVPIKSLCKKVNKLVCSTGILEVSCQHPMCWASVSLAADSLWYRLPGTMTDTGISHSLERISWSKKLGNGLGPPGKDAVSIVRNRGRWDERLPVERDPFHCVAECVITGRSPLSPALLLHSQVSGFIHFLRSAKDFPFPSRTTPSTFGWNRSSANPDASCLSLLLKKRLCGKAWNSFG